MGSSVAPRWVSTSNLEFTNCLGKQFEVLVIKNGFQLHGAGGLIDHIVESEKGAGAEFCGLIAREGVHGQFLAIAQLFLDLRQIIFGDAENHGDGLKLGDNHQRGGAARCDNVAGIDQAEAYAAARWAR